MSALAHQQEQDPSAAFTIPSTTTIVDFHGHWFPPSVVEVRAAEDMPPAVQRVWPLLTDLDDSWSSQRPQAPT